MSDDEAISAVLPTDDSDTSIGNVQGLEESNEENVNQTIAFNENVFPLGLSSYPLLPVSRLCKLTPGVNKVLLQFTFDCCIKKSGFFVRCRFPKKL